MLQQIDLQNVLNGVSRQPDNIRLASQAEEQINAVSDPVHGLLKRPGLEHLVGLSSVSAGAVFHIIDRDPNRRFLISVASNELKAWNLNTGAPATITFEASASYLTHAATSKAAFRMLTVADYTFITNTTTNTAMTADTVVRDKYRAIIFARNVKAGSLYRIFIDDISRSARGPDAYGNTEQFMDAVESDLVISLGTQFDFVRGADGTLSMSRKNNANFSIYQRSSNQELDIIKEVVRDFAQLPASAPEGFRIKVTGMGDKKQDDYWVKFVGPDSFGKAAGHWEETNGWGITTTINKATMPHALVIDSNGTSLTFKQIDWGQRKVGDDNTAPLPSFIGKPIEDMFFYRNRLGLLSDENIIFSEAGEFFNFFPTTVTDLLDSDPIDVATSHTKVSILKKAVPVGERLLVLSNSVQFLDNINTEGLLTPQTAAFKVRSEYLGDVTHANVEVARTSVMFPRKNGSYSRVWEYIPDPNLTPGQTIAVDITEHVPDYVAGDVTDMVFHQPSDSLYMLSSTYPNRIYVYRWLVQDNKRVQAAWSYWEFTDGSSGIVDIFAIDQYLYVVRKHDSTTDYRLGRIDLSEAPNFTSGSTSFHVHLDNRLSLTGVYDANNNYTTWTLPMAWPTNKPFSVVRGSGFSTLKGWEIQNTTRPTTTTVRATGNHSQAACWVGAPYEFLYRFSKFFMRNENGQPIEDGRTACKSITLQLKDTGYVKATVSREGQADRTYEAGPEIGGSLTTIGLKNSEFRVPLYTRNTNLGFKISSSSPYPVSLTKAKVIVEYNNKDREV